MFVCRRPVPQELLVLGCRGDRYLCRLCRIADRGTFSEDRIEHFGKQEWDQADIFFVPIQTRWWLPWQVARPTALTAPPCATGKRKEWQFLWLCGNKAPSHELWGGCARPSLLLLPPTVPVCGWIQSALTNARARPLYTHKHETLPNGAKSLATNPLLFHTERPVGKTHNFYTSLS